MGFGKFREMTRQKLHLTTDGAFKATSNARCEPMMKEADNFVSVVKDCEVSVQKMKRAISRILTATSKSNTEGLPRVHDVNDHTGKVEPVYTPGLIKGVDQLSLADGPTHTPTTPRTPTGVLTAVSGKPALPPVPEPRAPELRASEFTVLINNADQRLDNEVLKPLDNWLKKHEHAKASLKHTEAVRLEHDAKRRETYNLEIKHVKSKKGGDPDPALARDLETKEAVVAASEQRWHETEEALFGEVSQLVTEAGYISKYMALALHITSEATSNALAL